MLSKNMRCELCCFAATCFGLGAFMLTIVALEFSLGGEASQVRLLIAGPGIASMLMILLTAIAVRMASGRSIAARAPSTRSLRPPSSFTMVACSACRAARLLSSYLGHE